MIEEAINESGFPSILVCQNTASKFIKKIGLDKIDLIMDFLSFMSANKVASKSQNSLIALSITYALFNDYTIHT